MSGEPNSQRPETYDVGNLALNDGRLNFQLEPKPKQPVPSSPDFLNFLSTYEEDESEPVLGEEELKVNKTWVTGVADTKRDLSVRGSWEYDRLLFLSKLSLDRVAGRIGSTDSEIADAKSYMEFALDDRCNVHDDDRFRATSLLGQAYLASFRNQSTITFLKDSITYHLKAVTLCPEDSPQRVAVLIAYSESLLEGIRYEGGPEKLQRTFDALEEALRLCPQESDEYVQILHNIGISHVFRFDQNASSRDIDQCISNFEASLKIREPGHPDRHMSLSELANAYAKRFEHNGDPRNLDLTIKYCHEAVDIAPLKYGQDPTFLARIGDAYLQRYISRGNVEDLDLGIDYLRKAVEVSPKDFIHRFPAIGFLGRALTIRFELRKDRRDVEEAVIRTHQCMGVYSRGHPGRLIAFGDRGTALLNRYRSRNYPDVVQLKHVPEDSQKSPGHPSQALLRHPFPEGDDLESAIDDFRESLQLCPEGHPWHGRVLYNLADALLTRYEGSRRLIDQNNAQRYLESAQALLHKDDPILGMIFFASAREHLLRFESDYVDDAFSLYEKASTHRTLGTRQKLTGALSWVAAAEKYKHSSSLAAYKQTFILLDQQLNVVTDVLARHRIRKRLATNPTNAAACAINLGENDTAIELLEQGRGMLWMQLARLRTPIEDLRKLGPEEATLADRFEELSKVLDAGVTTIYRPISSEKSEDARERTANKHREVSERWEATVAEIRCIPGFTHFLQATPYSDLRDAAKEGPVVVFNINERRSDALVVSDAGAPYAIQLPHATPKTLASLSSHLSDVLAKTRAESDERYRTNQVVLVLRELWNVVIYPIVQYLLTSVQRKSRIWLCPTAELCSLPIHAAGQYRAKGTNLPDIFVCSYTPTLSALIRARQLPSDPEAPDITPAMLAIGESNDNVRGGETTLLSLSKEIEQLMDILPSHIPHRELLNTDATPEAVLQALHEHTWVHLACHGVQEPTQPFYSHFLLHGNSLRLLDVIQADLKHVKFAFTSACHTAVGDKNTSDEVIHLAAALQFAGFKSVVGTMWGMDDRDGPQITAEFYRAMFSEEKSMDHTEAANALNAAVKKMKKNKVSVDRRAVFIHIGA